LHDAYQSGSVFAVGGYLTADGASADDERAGTIVRLADETAGIEVFGSNFVVFRYNFVVTGYTFRDIYDFCF
jgi:hypothetical protein